MNLAKSVVKPQTLHYSSFEKMFFIGQNVKAVYATSSFDQVQQILIQSSILVVGRLIFHYITKIFYVSTYSKGKQAMKQKQKYISPISQVLLEDPCFSNAELEILHQQFLVFLRIMNTFLLFLKLKDYQSLKLNRFVKKVFGLTQNQTWLKISNFFALYIYFSSIVGFCKYFEQNVPCKIENWHAL